MVRLLLTVSHLLQSLMSIVTRYDIVVMRCVVRFGLLVRFYLVTFSVIKVTFCVNLFPPLFTVTYVTLSITYEPSVARLTRQNVSHFLHI